MINEVTRIINRNAFKKKVEFFESLLQYNYSLIKGEALSFYAYNGIGKRFSSDIDLLTTRNSLNSVEKLLEQFYFQKTLKSRNDKILMLSSSHQVAPWIKEIYPWGNVTIDLNFDIFWGEYTGKCIDIADFLSDTIELDIYGCKVKTLPQLKAMIQLILHHYKEMNSIYHLAGHNCINQNMFKDVYYLWRNNQEAISLEKLYKMSEEYEIIPFVFYVLYYTNQIFNDSELSKYVEVFRTEECAALLDYYGLAEKERKSLKVDFKTRLETENLYELIKNDLTDADIKKLERNRRIFG